VQAKDIKIDTRECIQERFFSLLKTTKAAQINDRHGLLPSPKPVCLKEPVNIQKFTQIFLAFLLQIYFVKHSILTHLNVEIR
jgi:hypothetical protein